MSVGSSSGIESSTVYQREQAEKEALAAGKVTHSDFLKLLTKQLTTQDPLNPMQDLDFTAQLAQLQALDEQMAMTKSLQAMRIDTQLQAGTNMIGKYVSGTDEAGQEVNGQVKRTNQKDGNVLVELVSGEKINVSNVSNVWNDATSMNEELANSGNVIGMWVEAGVDANKNPIQGIVEKVLVENGAVTLKLYGGEKVTWDQVTELRNPTEDELLYTLPDEVRQKIEEVHKMVDYGVTGVDANGEKVNGIVAGADFEGSTVYIVLYNGKKIELDKMEGDPRPPTADDAAQSLDGLWVVGLNKDGSDLGGKVVGAVEYDDGIALKLSNGKEVYLDTVKTIRTPTEEDLASESEDEDEGEGADETENP